MLEEDFWQCAKCQLRYSFGVFNLLLRAEAERFQTWTVEDGSAWETFQAAHERIGRSVQQIRNWVSKGSVRRTTRQSVVFTSVEGLLTEDATRPRRRSA